MSESKKIPQWEYEEMLKGEGLTDEEIKIVISKVYKQK